MRRVRAEHIARLVSIDGIVTRATEIKPLLTQAWFQCLAEACGHEFVRRQEEGRYNPPVACPNPECNRKGPFKLLVERSTFVDWQRITLQEKPEDLPAGQMPQNFSSVLRDDLVDVVRPGDRVLVTGVLRSHPERMLKRGQLATYTRVLEGVACEKETEQYEKVEILPEDEENILELAQDPVIVRKIVQSIAPSIHGYEVVKEAIACLLFGGAGKETPDGMRIRGDVNILMVGDPGTGKSQILKNISSLAPRGLYTSGRGSSAAGLTAAVMRDPDSGEMSLEAGALVLADEGIAAIDEFDKMRSEDRSAIHEALEQHTVSIAKAGIVATLNARAAVLAAANPREGRWDPWKEPAYNINLPPTLLSRFDLIFPLTDQPDEVEDER
ncbi:MAG: ATP-binding protein, partial [Candidatus Hodarchaeales archaeon]